MAFLCQREWEDEKEDVVDLHDCLYRMYEAKRSAQKNRHVGELTAFEVLTPGGKRFDIADDWFKMFKISYESRLTQKPFAVLTTPLLKDEEPEDKQSQKTAQKATA